MGFPGAFSQPVTLQQARQFGGTALDLASAVAAIVDPPLLIPLQAAKKALDDFIPVAEASAAKVDDFIGAGGAGADFPSWRNFTGGAGADWSGDLGGDGTLRETGVWAKMLPGFHSEEAAGVLLSYAGGFANMLGQHLLWRSAMGVNFLVRGAPGIISSGSWASNLNDCGPFANDPGESDLDMLGRLHPELTWHENFAGTRLIGTFVDMDADNSIEVFYFPAGSFTFADFLEAVKYHSDGDGTIRNALVDALNLIPFAHVTMGWTAEHP